MRTHGFRTHVLLVLAGAVGVLAALGRPWYARAPRPAPGGGSHGIGEVNGPLYGLFHGLQRWVGHSDGVTGWHALGDWGTALAVLAVVAALAALGATAPALQAAARDPLRFCALAVAGVVAWRLLDPPGPNDVWELRNGALVGAGGALVLLCGALPVASAPRRARAAAPSYVAPLPPPPAHDTSRSTAPPGA